MKTKTSDVIQTANELRTTLQNTPRENSIVSSTQRTCRREKNLTKQPNSILPLPPAELLLKIEYDGETEEISMSLQVNGTYQGESDYWGAVFIMAGTGERWLVVVNTETLEAPEPGNPLGAYTHLAGPVLLDEAEVSP